MMAGPKHFFSRSRCKLASAAVAGGEKLALRQAFRELEDSYSRNNSSLRRSRFVCDFSSNDLSLDDVNQIATWLEGSSLRIFALDLSFNRIFSDSWAPILGVIGRLDAHVGNLQLGGNYLPALTETDELKKLQHLGWVSLALPITGSPATEWQENWNNIAVDFGAKAYGFDGPGDGADGGSEAASMRIAEQYLNAFGGIAKAGATLLLSANSSDPASMVAQALSTYDHVSKTPLANPRDDGP